MTNMVLLPYMKKQTKTNNNNLWKLSSPESKVLGSWSSTKFIYEGCPESFETVSVSHSDLYALQ